MQERLLLFIIQNGYVIVAVSFAKPLIFVTISTRIKLTSMFYFLSRLVR